MGTCFARNGHKVTMEKKVSRHSHYRCADLTSYLLFFPRVGRTKPLSWWDSWRAMWNCLRSSERTFCSKQGKISTGSTLPRLAPGPGRSASNLLCISFPSSPTSSQVRTPSSWLNSSWPISVWKRTAVSAEKSTLLWWKGVSTTTQSQKWMPKFFQKGHKIFLDHTQ